MHKRTADSHGEEVFISCDRGKESYEVYDKHGERFGKVLEGVNRKEVGLEEMALRVRQYLYHQTQSSGSITPLSEQGLKGVSCIPVLRRMYRDKAQQSNSIPWSVLQVRVPKGGVDGD